MNTYYCPLCGEEFMDVRDCGRYLWRCDECDYTLGESVTIDDAIDVVEAFLSKFPVSMRLRVGDRVEVKCKGVGTVDEIEFDDYTLPFHVDYGDESEWVGVKDIEKFPWELEERGAK